MTEPADKNAADIRSLYVETIAKAFYEAEADDEKATTGIVWPSWDRLDKSEPHRAIQDARLAVAALAEAGRLPTQRQQMPGKGRFRYVTAWQDPSCEACIGTGHVKCWSPGGPCPDEGPCECCGPCNECEARR